MSSKDTSYLLLLAAISAFFYYSYTRPKLTYQWLNGQLVFNLTAGGKGINGTVSPNDTTLTNTVSWQGNTAFSVVPQVDSVFFQVQQGDKIIFTQTVNKQA
jgi:hypothetical protein